MIKKIIDNLVIWQEALDRVNPRVDADWSYCMEQVAREIQNFVEELKKEQNNVN